MDRFCINLDHMNGAKCRIFRDIFKCATDLPKSQTTPRSIKATFLFSGEPSRTFAMLFLLTFKLLTLSNGFILEEPTGRDQIDDGFINFKNFITDQYSMSKNRRRVLKRIKRSKERIIKPFNAVVRVEIRF